MSFDWQDYWRLAEYCQLQANTTGVIEAALRSSISRAYYSVFCSARNLARRRRVKFPRGNVHQELPLYFRARADLIEQQLGHHLERLRKHRNEADYDDTFSNDLAKTAEFVVKTARRMHSTIDSLPKK